MGYELSYETWLNRIPADQLEEEIEENKKYKEQVENEILALIMMDPSKVRNIRKRSKKDEDYDGDDTSYLNNVQYLLRVWQDLKEQWEEATCKIARCSDAQYAVERKTRKVDLCPDCLIELEWLDDESTKGEYGYCKKIPTCPKCHKHFAEYPYEQEANEGKQKPAEAEIRTYTESY